MWQFDRGALTGTNVLTEDFVQTDSGGATFVVNVPNGTYNVTPTMGDALWAHDLQGIYLQGIQVDTITSAANQYVSRTYSVTVTTGQIQFTFKDLGGVDLYDALDSLDIAPATGTTSTPGAPVLAAVTDSGVSSSDGVTFFNNGSVPFAPQFTVPGTLAGANVTLYADGTIIGSALATGTTTTITASGNQVLANGVHSFTAVQTLPSQIQSATSLASTVKIDTVAPTASSSLAGVTTAGGTSYSFTVSYNDSTGVNAATLNSRDVLVTNNSASFSQLATFVSAAPSGNGTALTATYTFIPPGGAWSSSGNGTYTVALQSNVVGDIAGNYSVGGTLGTFSVNIASTGTSPTPSTPSLTAGTDSGLSSSDAITDYNGSSAPWSPQFSIPGTVAGATVTVYSDGTAIGSVTATGTTTIVTDTARLADGSHSITATQTVPGQLVSASSASKTIVVDSAAPVAASTPAGVTTAGATIYTFTVTYTDLTGVNPASLHGGDILVTGPNAYQSLAVFVSSTTSGNKLTATYSVHPPGGAWSSSGNGTYTVALQSNVVGDIAGNYSVGGTLGTFSVNIASTGTSPTPSTPSLTAGTDSGLSSSDAITDYNGSSAPWSPQFSIPGTVAGATVTVYSDGTAIGSVTATGTTTIVTDTARLADGSHSITATQTVPGQLVSASSASKTIVVDSAAPVAASTPAGVTTAGATIYTFTVTYTDLTGVNPASLHGGDILVTGPNAYQSLAVFVSSTTSGNKLTATYSVHPPGGAWSSSGNGTYTVALQPNVVGDIAGNYSAGGILGTFSVNI